MTDQTVYCTKNLKTISTLTPFLLLAINLTPLLPPLTIKLTQWLQLTVNLTQLLSLTIKLTPLIHSL